MTQSTDATLSQLYGYLALGLVGVVLTVLLLPSGRYTASAGPLHFDAFYGLSYGFAFLVVVSGILLFVREKD